jgi:hypothetical protein
MCRGRAWPRGGRERLRWGHERLRGGGTDICAPQPTVCAPPAVVCTPQSSVCAPYAGVCAPMTGICAPQPAICARSNPDHPTWQRCGRDVAATVDKVSPDLSCPRSTRRWPLSDGHKPYRTWRTDGWTHRQPGMDVEASESNRTTSHCMTISSSTG